MNWFVVDGEDGVMKASSKRLDLNLMKLNLPVLDGGETTHRIKREPSTRSIPIIALTAHAVSGNHEQAMEAGCDDSDTKPIEMARLRKIEVLL